jgi:hypothetical protein
MMETDEFLTIEELCKLRRMRCKAKYKNLVLLGLSAKLETMSDEAFAILTFDNNIDKWIDILEEEKEKAKTEITIRRKPEGITRQERQRNRSLREKRTTSRKRWKGG